MKPSRTYIDHTADILFKAEAPTLEELFVQCALALEESQVEINLIEKKEELTITGKEKTLERLLFNFLDDLVFHKDSDLLIFNDFSLNIKKDNDEYHLTCLARGEKIDHAKHEPKVDVKAITMHMFYVKEIENGWEAQVLIDI